MNKQNLFRRYALIVPLFLQFLAVKRQEIEKKVAELQATPTEPAPEEITLG